MLAMGTPSLAQEQASNQNGNDQPQPNVVCENPTFEFGKKINTNDIEHEFIIKNTGDAPLEVSDVHHTCACTVAEISSKRIMPGEEAKVAVTLTLKGRKGQQTKVFSVVSNDPDTPLLKLFLKGETYHAVDISNARVMFNKIGQETNAVSTVEIRSNTDNPVNITDIQCKSQVIETEHTVVEEGKVHRISIRTKPPMELGRKQETVAIYTDDEKYPVFYVPVNVLVVDKLSYSPKEIVLTKRRQNPGKRIVFVSPGTIHRFTVDKVETPDESIEAKIIKLESGSYKIELTGLSPNDDLAGKQIKLTTSVKGMEEIVIPFKIIP